MLNKLSYNLMKEINEADTNAIEIKRQVFVEGDGIRIEEKEIPAEEANLEKQQINESENVLKESAEDYTYNSDYNERLKYLIEDISDIKTFIKLLIQEFDEIEEPNEDDDNYEKGGHVIEVGGSTFYTNKEMDDIWSYDDDPDYTMEELLDNDTIANFLRKEGLIEEKVDESEDLKGKEILNELGDGSTLDKLIHGDEVYFRNDDGLALMVRYADNYPAPEDYDEGYTQGWERGADEEFDKEQDEKYNNAKQAAESGDVWEILEIDEDTLQPNGTVAGYIYGQAELEHYLNYVREVKVKKSLEEAKKICEKCGKEVCECDKSIEEAAPINSDLKKGKEDRLASLKTQLEQDGDQLSDDEKKSIEDEIAQLEKEVYTESEELTEGEPTHIGEIVKVDPEKKEITYPKQDKSDSRKPEDPTKEEILNNKIEEAEVTNLKMIKNQGNIFMLEADKQFIVGENYNEAEKIIENAEIYGTKEEADKDYFDRCGITLEESVEEKDLSKDLLGSEAEKRQSEADRALEKYLDLAREIKAGNNDTITLDSAKELLKNAYIKAKCYYSFEPEEIDRRIAKDIPDLFGDLEEGVISDLKATHLAKKAAKLNKEKDFDKSTKAFAKSMEINDKSADKIEAKAKKLEDKAGKLRNEAIVKRHKTVKDFTDKK